jgi:hypothetical protein
MYYNLIIHDNNPWIHLDMAHQIQTLIKYKGKNSQIIILWNLEDLDTFDLKDGKNIYIGRDVYDIYIKPGSIITEFNQSSKCNFQNFTSDVLENTIMSCYSNILVNEYNSKFPFSKAVKFKFGYSDIYDTPSEKNKIYDVCFICNPIHSQRRYNIIKNLQDEGLNIFYNKDYFLVPEKRSEYYKKSKIVLYIYENEEQLDYSSGGTVFPAVSAGGNFVISEKCKDESEHKILSDVCVNVNYNEIVPTIKYFLKNDQLKNNLANKFYQKVKSTYADIGIEL